MSTTFAALIATLFTTGMTSTVSHELTIIGGSIATLIFAASVAVRRNANVYPAFLLGTVSNDRHRTGVFRGSAGPLIPARFMCCACTPHSWPGLFVASPFGFLSAVHDGNESPADGIHPVSGTTSRKREGVADLQSVRRSKLHGHTN